MYSLSLPVSAIRTKIRQEFERHRYVNQLPVVDVLVAQSNIEFQETLNYWKQLSHVMKYFRIEEDPTAKLPKNFMSGFLEVSYYPRRSDSPLDWVQFANSNNL
ncbi:NADH dehydrogenase (ubiquinone) 1 alpha subcomplex 6 [[Emmonsia] crescens]|uniref:NADH dehydrogenase (Ubiquinone) 1 alpha subcomplex 6 n=1 Tax=[Emmonsia] crescens TaxID=73230 RepID=A0A2B7ZDT3_9EURO|nr:NADH dehydrogenase (ubiquinone) 1 alpha subcomplex 6 [Emmonsia crescens]